MRPELAQQVERLKSILLSHQIEFAPRPGATFADIAEVERRVGIQFDADLKDFWQFSNGSDYELWFAVESDQLTPCCFPPLEEALEAWSWFEPYDAATYEEWSDASRIRDERIQPAYLHHRLWFPIAEFNGFSTAVYFDADPTDQGEYGQIIVYQHDPDAVYYVASNFLAFFSDSNRLLEEYRAARQCTG